MYIVARVGWESWIVDEEAQRMQVCGDDTGTRLLTIHADGKSLDSPKEEERIDGGKRISDGVDDECELLEQK